MHKPPPLTSPLTTIGGAGPIHSIIYYILYNPILVYCIVYRS